MSEEQLTVTWASGVKHQIDFSITVTTNSKEAAVLLERKLKDDDPRTALLNLLEMIIRTETFEGNKELDEANRLVFQLDEIYSVDINWDDEPEDSD